MQQSKQVDVRLATATTPLEHRLGAPCARGVRCLAPTYPYPGGHSNRAVDQICSLRSIAWSIDSYVEDMIGIEMDQSNSTTPVLLSESVLAMRDAVKGQVEFVRNYTLGLLENTPDELWPIIPGGASTHVAWQVGHLAVSQYGLMLFRQRGRAEGDLELMPGWLRKRFGRGSIPPTDPLEMPDKSTLLECLNKIHNASMAALPTFSAEQLLEATEMPYAVHPIKLGALLFCPLHESIHIGQIGILRRLHGLAPVR